MGHLPGLRQQARNVTFRLETPSPTAARGLEQLDDLLQRWTALPPTGRKAAPIGSAVLAERVLALAAHLLKLARAPVFEPGRVVNIAVEEDGAARVTALVPSVDVLAAHELDSAYRLAISIVQRAMVTQAAEPNPEQAQQEIFARFIEPARRTTHEGGNSSVHLLNAAFEADVPFLHLGRSRYCLGWGSRAVRLHRSSVSTDSHWGAMAGQSKSMTAQILRKAGIPVPAHHLVSNRQQAAEAARAIGWPVVLKPDDRDRGEGVTTDINDEASLYAAFEAAAAFSRRILVEDQAPGRCHRILVAFGRIFFAAVRLPKRVQGDGALSVEELVARANSEAAKKPTWDRHKPWLVDEIATKELRKQGLEPSSVPEEGRWVHLRARESPEWGGDVQDLTEELHPDNASICIRAARQLGLDIAGVDLMTEDATVPWHANGALINEVNPAPLLGGGPNSRGKFPMLFNWMFPQGSRIPVHAILGAQGAWKRAHAIRTETLASGQRCCVTDHERTLGPDGTELVLTARGLYARCTALLLDPVVDRVVMVVSNDELLRTGSPVDRFTTVEDHSGREPCIDGLDVGTIRRLKELLEPMGESQCSAAT